MLSVLEKDELRRLREAEAFHKEQTKTDLALVEEAKRYVQPDCLSHEPPLSPSFLFGRIPVGEFCDLSGPGKKCDEDENPLQMIMGSESPLRKNGECWDLVEVSKSSTDDGGKDVSSDQIVHDAKRRVIKAVIRSQRVDLFCLQETKIETLSEGVVRSLGSGRWSNWTALDAMGTAGGILVCWDKRSLEVMETEVGKFSVSCRIRNVENGMIWIFTGVYGPFTKEDRDCLWEELGAIRGLWEEPWCIGGDFNVILSQRERSRQGRLSGAMRNFAQTVDDLELIDLPMQGGIATWSGGRNNQSWARLDRFLVTQQWLDMFRSSPGWWQGIEARGRASFRLAYKMKVVKQNIKVWNREVFGRVEVNKNSALQQLEHWDGVESERRAVHG
ncbi:hypothetical protein CK203_066250 [Vitis vinifera]|uniref:Endonuclease/exonuclease/phosphatase domain-containing protein n=1 Tax=Vitis vinifera TaxID=29760 RepID=A0A438G256_VITVI|nr:hypothetical protein CK203_066250 [Vitis vinifera]